MSDYDFSEVGKARRRVITTLDDYGCTVDEFCVMFGVKESAFYRYAKDTRLKFRPTEILMPTTWAADKPPRPVPMTPADALEIATVTLLRANTPVAVIVEALRGKVSKSSVYRMRTQSWWGVSSPAERRMLCRHLPSLPDWRYKSPVEKRREARWRRERWVTRARGKVD